MKRDRLPGQTAAILAGILVVGFTFGGCSDDNVAGPEEEGDGEVLRSIIQDSTSEFADWFNFDSFFGEGEEGLQFSGPSILRAPQEAIETRRWWREPIRPFDFQITVVVEGDSAFVESQVTINGILHLLAYEEGMEGSLVEYTKDFQDLATQRAAFIRYPDSLGIFRRGWRLEYVSHVESESPNATVAIDSVVLNAVGSEERRVIRDPLALRHRTDVPLFPNSTEVEISVYYQGDPALVFLHTGRRGSRRRYRIEQEEPGVARGTWRTPVRPGVFHAAVDLLDENTLLDDTYPYDSNTWLIVYRTRGVVPD